MGYTIFRTKKENEKKEFVLVNDKVQQDTKYQKLIQNMKKENREVV